MSPAAVSSVLTNRQVERRLATATVEKIRAAATAMGYTPNMAGRRLQAHDSRIRQIDLAIFSSYEAPLPLVGQTLRAMELAVDSQISDGTRYLVAIEMFHAGRLRDKPGLLDANRYHGVILTNTLPEDDHYLSTVSLPYAVIALGRQIPGFHCVLEMPDYVGGRSAEVLLDAGCREPVIMHGRLLTQATADRVTAFQRVVKKRLGRLATCLVCEDLTPPLAGVALQNFFRRGEKCDGIFTVTDSLAVGAYQAIKQSGRKIPHDVAVVGVGDYELAEFFDPPLSTLAGANDAMAAKAVPLLFRMLRGEKDLPLEVFVMPPVYLRASTGRP